MNPILKLVAGGATAAFVIASVALGFDAPRTPAQLAASTGRAADNLATAVDNTSRSVEQTEAFAQISHNVVAQMKASSKLLALQLELERSSLISSRHSAEVQRALGRLRGTFRDVGERVGRLTALTSRNTEAGARAALAGEELYEQLARLKRRFQKVVLESRRLNRRARAFEKLREGP